MQLASRRLSALEGSREALSRRLIGLGREGISINRTPPRSIENLTPLDNRPPLHSAPIPRPAANYKPARSRLARCELPLFEPLALEAIFPTTEGMPRKINRLVHYVSSEGRRRARGGVAAGCAAAALRPPGL